MSSPQSQTESSAPRSDEHAFCPYFGECGGCSAQDLEYAAQLTAKSQYLSELLGEHWTNPIEVLPSPEIRNYRNKIDMNFSRRQYDEPPPKDFCRETVLGYNRKGKWYWPLDIEACAIAPRCSERILPAARAWYREHDVRAEDRRSGDGPLRALLVREGRRTGESMVMLCTNGQEVDTKPFVHAMANANVDSVYLGISRGRSQGAFADELVHLAGEKHIHEELHINDGNESRTYRFRISPLSFFQTNTLGTEILYSEIRAWVERVAPRILYDLYGGAGGIAIACADLAETVRSVDNVPEATADGEANLALNGIENIFFATGEMKNYLLHLGESGGMEDESAAILDPSRSGLNPKVIRRFLATRPRRFLYVSCNPRVFAQELPSLLEEFTMESVKAVDMFPHTPHVELLSSFVRR